MNMRPCPRCRGTGVVEETGTLVGLSPFQDRPSIVNDDDWVPPPAESGDLTLVREVPSFRPPRPGGPRIPSPKPPPDNTRIARDSERPTALLIRGKRRSVWPALLVTVAVAAWLGFAAGTGLLAAWVTFVRHVVRARLGR